MEHINSLLPIIQRLALAHVKLCLDKGITTKIYCGYRSFEEQAGLYNQGRTTQGRIVTYAKPGQSPHQHKIAYDMVPIINGKAIWNDDHLWEILGKEGQALGLEWGGEWNRFKDKVHFQFMARLSIEEISKLCNNELNAYLQGWLAGSGSLQTLEIAEKDL